MWKKEKKIAVPVPAPALGVVDVVATVHMPSTSRGKLLAIDPVRCVCDATLDCETRIAIVVVVVVAVVVVLLLLDIDGSGIQ